jgi:hypothetical protein
MILKPAQRADSRVRVALYGASGSGKTYSAIKLAKGLSINDTIAIIDTESGSANLYSHLGSFQVLNLSAPFTPERCIEAINVCVASGADVVVFDSLSHEWEGSGGILEMHAQMPGNSFANWGKIMPRHNALIHAMLSCPAHVVVTLRTKQDYQVSTERGGMSIQKLGLKPVQKDGIDYEFTIAFEVSMNHKSTASKDRTGLFVDQPPFQITQQTGRTIQAWCTPPVTHIQSLNQLKNINHEHFNHAKH